MHDTRFSFTLAQLNEMAQDVLRLAKMAGASAAELIGEERTADIRFAVFLSKNPKPVSPKTCCQAISTPRTTPSGCSRVSSPTPL